MESELDCMATVRSRTKLCVGSGVESLYLFKYVQQSQKDQGSLQKITKLFQAMKKGGTPILPHFGPNFRILTSVFSGPFFDDFPTYPISTVKQYWQLKFGQGSPISKLKLPVLYF